MAGSEPNLKAGIGGLKRPNLPPPKLSTAGIESLKPEQRAFKLSALKLARPGGSEGTPGGRGGCPPRRGEAYPSAAPPVTQAHWQWHWPDLTEADLAAAPAADRGSTQAGLRDVASHHPDYRPDLPAGHMRVP
jgi:hypothetical protein